jgi:hypothetical protein
MKDTESSRRGHREERCEYVKAETIRERNEIIHSSLLCPLLLSFPLFSCPLTTDVLSSWFHLSCVGESDELAASAEAVAAVAAAVISLSIGLSKKKRTRA